MKLILSLLCLFCVFVFDSKAQEEMIVLSVKEAILTKAAVKEMELTELLVESPKLLISEEDGAEVMDRQTLLNRLSGIKRKTGISGVMTYPQWKVLENAISKRHPHFAFHEFPDATVLSGAAALFKKGGTQYGVVATAQEGYVSLELIFPPKGKKPELPGQYSETMVIHDDSVILWREIDNRKSVRWVVVRARYLKSGN